MSCRTTKANSTIVSLAKIVAAEEATMYAHNKVVTLEDSQITSLFHQLRAEYPNGGEPISEERWEEFWIMQRKVIQRTMFLTDAREKSLLSRIDLAAKETPSDPSTFYALTYLSLKATRQTDTLNKHLREQAQQLGIKSDDLIEEYTKLVAEAQTDRSHTPTGYTEANITRWRKLNLPTDKASFAALTKLMKRVTKKKENDEKRAAERRIQHNPITPATLTSRQSTLLKNGKSFVSSVGYAEEDGRLELMIMLPNGTTVERAYHSVPTQIWKDLISTQDIEMRHSYIAKFIQGNPECRYRNAEEAAEAGGLNKCSDCGRFAGRNHECPIMLHSPETSTVSDNSTVRTPGRPKGSKNKPAHEKHEHRPGLVTRQVLATTRANTAQKLQKVEKLAEEAYHSVYNGYIVEANHRRAFKRLSTSHPLHHMWVTFPEASIVKNRAKLNDKNSYPIEMYASATREGEVGWKDEHGNQVGEMLRSDQKVVGRVFVTTNTAFSGADQWVIETKLRCPCSEYQQSLADGDNPAECPHTKFVVDYVVRHCVPEGVLRDNGIVSYQTALAEHRRELFVNEAHKEAAAAVWSGKKDAEELLSSYQTHESHGAATVPYAEDFDAYKKIADEARAHRKAGEPFLEYSTHNALNGLLSPQSGQGFGVELEFVLNMSNEKKATALRKIGEDLKAAGLTGNEEQQEYAYAKDEEEYNTQIRGGWSFEEDSTVDGELVSPIMYDTPETWEALREACEIIKKHGGHANSKKVGSHIHVGTPPQTPLTVVETVRFVNQFEDVIFRAAANPETGEHRPLEYCQPNHDVMPRGYTATDIHNGLFTEEGREYAHEELAYEHTHGMALNFDAGTGSNADHIEFRQWDGTLDPAVIQSQVRMSAAIASAGYAAGLTETDKFDSEQYKKHDERKGQEAYREKVGTHRILLDKKKQRHDRLSRAAEQKDTETFRTFVDTLFTRDSDKENITALFAVNKWADWETDYRHNLHIDGHNDNVDD